MGDQPELQVGIQATAIYLVVMALRRFVPRLWSESNDLLKLLTVTVVSAVAAGVQAMATGDTLRGAATKGAVSMVVAMGSRNFVQATKQVAEKERPTELPPLR